MSGKKFIFLISIDYLLHRQFLSAARGRVAFRIRLQSLLRPCCPEQFGYFSILFSHPIGRDSFSSYTICGHPQAEIVYNNMYLLIFSPWSMQRLFRKTISDFGRALQHIIMFFIRIEDG